MAVTSLHLVLCGDGGQIMLGPQQAKWALEQGLIKLESENETSEHTSVKTYFHQAAAAALNERIQAEPAIRECDFCGITPARWIVPLRPFKPKLGPMVGFTIGGHGRPLYCCFICQTLVGKSDRRQLREKMFHRAARQIAALHGHHPGETVAIGAAGRRALTPQLNHFLMDVFSSVAGKGRRI